MHDFGAVGDGVNKDTKAIQKAIDSCASAGGGTVVFPSGTYLSGTIYLKSHVELHLSAGATILGSPDREDYNEDDAFPENDVFYTENVTGAHLIISYCQEDVSITGTGTIDGNSSQFLGSLKEDYQSYWYKKENFPVFNWRPGQMVFLCRCKKINVSNVSFNNSTYWNLLFLGCEDVHITGLTITNHPATPNGDGIDIDCSRNVTISDCIIRSGDDCITVRANKRKLGENAIPSENITVTNCILSTTTCAFRIGVGDGKIRNCRFDNIVVSEARTAISMILRYSASTIHGAQIEQIHFSNFTIDALIPFQINAGKDVVSPASLCDISFSSFRIKAWAGAQIIGDSEVPIENIKFDNVDWKIHGGTDNCSYTDELPAELSKFGYHGMNGTSAMPCVLYGRHLKNIVFGDVSIRWDTPSAVWVDGISIDRSSDIEFCNVKLRQPKDDTGAAIKCLASSNISLKACQAEKGTHTFLKVEESPNNTQIKCMGNNLLEAVRALDVDVNVTEVGNLF